MSDLGVKLLLVAFGIALLSLLVWRCRGVWNVVLAARAHESFHLQRERLETLFMEAASKTGLPRGLRWIGCEFSGEPIIVRERSAQRICVLVDSTIRYEAIEGSDMEGLPAVPIPRAGTAVLLFQRGEWICSGRVIFNLSPAEVVERFGNEFVADQHAGS
jgi:hypothetical protein